ncbi:CBS domain-containing protein [Halomonas cibimaris]|uniref:CBS domain-containing protein n=1 Tax=Halomonas cibimaris TaxID=657012 RepID=A0ABP7LFI6_9GAMM
MQAADVMTPDVISVHPDGDVSEIATLLLTHGISAVPVVDDNNGVVGVVSEADLMRRIKSETAPSRSWWLNMLGSSNSAADYVKSHGRRAKDVMTPNPVTITEDTPLHRIARLLEKHHIKLVPVVKHGRMTGIVSRSNLLRGFSAHRIQAGGGNDREIRDAILEEIKKSAGMMVYRPNVIVSDGHVQLWGLVKNHTQKQAVKIAAENVAGVKTVENNLGLTPQGMGG